MDYSDDDVLYEDLYDNPQIEKNKNINQEEKKIKKISKKSKVINNNNQNNTILTIIDIIERKNKQFYADENYIGSMGRIKIVQNCTICQMDIYDYDDIITNFCGHKQHMVCWRKYFNGPILLDDEIGPNPCPKCEMKKKKK